MKDTRYMHDIPEVPLSPDPSVTRQYDLGLNRQLSEITFFSLSEDLINDCNGRVHTMCNELGGGGGSVRYNQRGIKSVHSSLSCDSLHRLDTTTGNLISKHNFLCHYSNNCRSKTLSSKTSKLTILESTTQLLLINLII